MSGSKPPVSKLLWLILAGCLGIRIIHLLMTGLNAELTGDGPGYMQAAQSIARGTYPLAQPITRPPFYPLLISAFLGLGAYCVPAIRIFQAVLDTAGCLLLAGVCRRLFSEKTALAATAVYAVNPFFVFDAATVHTETLYQFLVILACLLYVLVCRASKPAWLIFAAGVVIGLSALTRPQSMLLLLALVAITAWKIKPDGMRKAAWILAGAVATMAPWTARNAIIYGEFVPVTDGAGYTFWLGNNRALLQKFRTASYSDFLRIDRRVYFEDTPLIGRPVEDASPRTRDAFWYRQGIGAIRELGAEYPHLLAYKLGVYFRPTVSPQAYGMRKALFLLLFPGTLFILGFAVFVREFFRWNSALAPLLIFVCSCFVTGLALAVLFQSQLRFRVPLLDPWLIVFASWKLTGSPTRIPVQAHAKEIAHPHV